MIQIQKYVINTLQIGFSMDHEALTLNDLENTLQIDTILIYVSFLDKKS